MPGRKWFHVATVTGFSQLLAAAVTVGFTFAGPSLADLYSLGLQLGTVPLSGVAVGIVYNLAIGRSDFDQWNVWAKNIVLIGVGLTVMQLVAYLASGDLEREYFYKTTVVLGLFGLGGVFVGLAGLRAVWLACNAQPIQLAGVTVIPNFGLAIGLILTIFTQSFLFTAFGWLVGSMTCYLILRVKTKKLSSKVRSRSNASDSIYLNHSLGLILGGIVSTVLPLFFALSLTSLPAGSVFTALLLAKIATSSLNVFVNSFLTARSSWHSSFRFSSRLIWAAGLTFPVMAVAATIFQLLNQFVLAQGFFILGWFGAMTASALAIRELNAEKKGRLLLVKTSIELLVSIGIAIVLFAKPSILGYISAFAFSQGLTILISGVHRSSAAIKVVGLFCIATAISFIFVWG